MHILLIPSGDWFSRLPTRHKFLARILGEMGHDIHVLRIATSGNSRPPETHGVHVHELKGVQHSNRVTGNEILHYATSSVAYASAIREIVSTVPIDVILSSNLLPSVAATIVARARGIPVVYDVIDFFPDFVYRYKDDGLGLGLLQSIASRVFDFNLRHADRIIVLGEATREYVLRTVGPERRKAITILPNGIPREIAENGHSARSILARQSRAIGLRVALVGSLEFWIDTTFIVDFIRTLRTLDPTASLTVLGGRPDSGSPDVVSELRQRWESSGLQDGLFLRGFVPYDQLWEELPGFHIGLVPFKTGLQISQNALPLKVLEYLAAGSVVVSTPLRELMNFAKGAAIFEGDGSAAALQAFSLLQDPARLSDLRVAGSSLARRNVWDELAIVLERELREAVEGGSGKTARRYAR
jgi:glycosyltransferase involved in cell wall biosynthesis